MNSIKVLKNYTQYTKVDTSEWSTIFPEPGSPEATEFPNGYVEIIPNTYYKFNSETGGYELITTDKVAAGVSLYEEGEESVGNGVGILIPDSISLENGKLKVGNNNLIVDTSLNSVGINTIPSHDGAFEVGDDLYVADEAHMGRVDIHHPESTDEQIIFHGDDSLRGRIILQGNTNRLYFRSKRTDASSEVYEQYRLPQPSTGESTNQTYEILTTKTAKLYETSLSANVSVPSGTAKNILSLTIPAGTYIIIGQLHWGASSSGTYRDTYLGTSTSGGSAWNLGIQRGTPTTTYVQASTLFTTAARTIYLNAQHNATGNLDVTSSLTWFSALRIF